MDITEAVQAIKNDLVEFTQTIVRIPSLNGEEGEVAQTILTKLQEFGLDESWIDGIGNVIAVLRGQDQGPNILLNGHMDVVPPGSLDQWRYDPFGAEIDSQGNIRGRGTADMKGGLAALVFTMKLMKDLRDQGFQLPGDIIFSAVVFEEAAEMFGMEYLCKTTLPQKGLNFDLCYLAEPTGGHVNLGHRGKVEVVVETHGKTAHSSQPWRGINALEKMVPVLDRIFNHMSRDLPYHPELGQCSMTITNIICKPGTLSIVPDYCEVSIDRRYVPGETLEGILGEFETMLDIFRDKDPEFKANAQIRTFVEKSYTGYEKRVQKHHPAWIIDNKHPYVRKTCQAINKVGLIGNTGYFIGGVDGAFIAGLMGIPTMGYSGADENLAHTYEEHVPVKVLVEDTTAYTAILCEIFNLDIL
jgi:putative selenium metabolism hydrolase